MKIHNNILHGPPITEVPNISLGQHVFDSLRANGDQIIQIDVQTDQYFTCDYVLEKSAILSTFMKNYGVNIEDRISVACENHPNYIITMCSTFFVGGTFAPLNPAYTEREFRYMLEILQPRLIFVSRLTERLLAKIASSINWSMKLIEVDDEALDKNIITLKEIVDRYKSVPDPRTFVPTPIDDTRKTMVAIMCSSGTTGFPKGVMLSHHNLLAFIRGSSDPSFLGMERGERSLIVLPMFHGYAFALMNLSIYCGSIMCVMKNFDLEVFLKSVEKYKITRLPVAPPILVALSKHPLVPKYDFGSVRELVCGAAALPKNILNDVKERTKVKCIRNGYGMTELTMVSNISDRSSKDDNVGPVLPSFKCKVIDTKTGRTLGPGEIGELCFAGDQIMLGYFKNPKTTAETIDKENWLHTGDLGYFNEEGCLYITGRIKELIKYKGFQVSPSEIEMIILTHPSVKDVAVVGKPDELSGEVPMAFVVKQPNKNVLAKEIVDFANGNLSPQKWLRGGVKFIDSVPKTAAGKIQRQELLNMISKL